jgi:hypothetical protein
MVSKNGYGYQDPQGYDKLNTLLTESGLLDKKIDTASIFTNSFLK